MKQYYVQPDRDAYQSVHGIDSVLFTLLLERNRSLVQEFAEFAAQSSDISVARIFWVGKGEAGVKRFYTRDHLGNFEPTDTHEDITSSVKCTRAPTRYRWTQEQLPALP